MRVAFSSIAWNTGSSSPGEPEMTFKTSEVAVCSSSDFAKLVEQPRVLNGDDGLRREVLDQLDLLVGERADFLAEDDNRANQFVLLEHRHGNKRPRAAEFGRYTGIFSAVSSAV